MHESQIPSLNVNTTTFNTTNTKANNNNHFICGVVEGFYGKPWTFCQRKDLFKRLKEFNLNAFMYAPKDDTKHRAKWRQLYNESEAQELKALIDEANANGIDFYYSLAPGLDMIYSSQEETEFVCQKFNQVRSLGCKSYAILFDDIEPNLTNERDRVIFHDNYAAAQVSITNHIYDYLDKPKLLFCPTEYCESRAAPNVLQSNYLNTIGKGLHNAIDIMWSGPRVVSRLITEESIKQLNSVIRRPAVIWENLHANDYDKKRVYLGPYSGRSTKIIPLLRGVLTNPNCEYEANYVAIHTLAQWSKCTEDVNLHNRCNQERQPQIGTATTTHNPIGEQHYNSESVYDPDRALVRAIRDWLPHVLSSKSLPQGFDISASHVRNDEIASDQMTKDEQKASSLQVEDHGAKDVEIEEDAEEMSEDKSPGDSSTGKSEMDTSCSPAPKNTDTNSCDSCEMQDVTCEPPPPPVNIGCIACTTLASAPSGVASGREFKSRQVIHKVDLDSLTLLVDFFYLPFEHGVRGHAFLRDIKWLIDNSGIFALITVDEDDEGGDHVANDESRMKEVEEEELSVPISGADSKLVELWAERADKLNNFCTCINRIIDSLVYDCPNKQIMVELYPYLVELRDVIIMIMDYIKFLRHRKFSSERFYFSGGLKRREFATSDEQEPWVHRGGLIGDVQRLIS